LRPPRKIGSAPGISLGCHGRFVVVMTGATAFRPCRVWQHEHGARVYARVPRAARPPVFVPAKRTGGQAASGTHPRGHAPVAHQLGKPPGAHQRETRMAGWARALAARPAQAPRRPPRAELYITGIMGRWTERKGGGGRLAGKPSVAPPVQAGSGAMRVRRPSIVTRPAAMRLIARGYASHSCSKTRSASVCGVSPSRTGQAR